MFKKFIGPKDFYKVVFSIILPIMLQQLFLSLAGYVDNIMINSFDEAHLAYNGVSAANRLMFILNFVWFGLVSAVSIFTAQFFGAGNKEKLKETVRLSTYISIIFGIIGFFVITFLGNFVVNSYIQDETARSFGYDYLNWIRWGAVCISLNMTFANAFRSIQKPKIPLQIGIIGILVNVFFNWCFIFGNLGFPCLGAEGAAIATVISKIVEVILYLISMGIYNKDDSLKHTYKKLGVSKGIIKDFIKRGTLIASNELLWSLGMVLLALFYTWKNDVWYNAYSYTQNISDLFFIVFAGLGNGTAILIGASLGRGDFEKAEKESRYFQGLAVIMGLIVGVLMISTSPLTSRMFTKDPDTIRIMENIMLVTSIFTAVYCYNSVNFFTLKAGGDSIRAVLLDQGATYILGIPIAIVLGVNASKIGITIVEVYLATHLVDLVKIFVGLSFIKKGKWLRNLTEENKEKELV